MRKYRRAPVAQWIEHPPPKGRVTRSIRVGGTKTLLSGYEASYYSVITFVVTMAHADVNYITKLP